MEDLYNINIEKAVLSSILFDPELFEDVSEKLNPEDFYLPAHQKLFAAMDKLHNQELPIDEEFLRKELNKEKAFDESAMIEIMAVNPISNTNAYLEEIKDGATKRHLAHFATEIKKITSDEILPVTDIIDQVEQKLYKITQDATSSDFKTSDVITIDTLNHIKKMKERGNSYLVGMDTGFIELNKMTSGFGEGDLIILAARPAMGKTAFALNIVLKNLERDNGVVFFSLEMPAEQLMLRLVSAKTSIPLQKLRVGDMSDQQWSTLSSAFDELSTKPLFVDDDGAVNINQLRAKLRKLKAHHPEVKIAVIDYLQLMSGTGSKDRHQEISEISRGLKMLARELDMPIIALSQLNRGLEARADKRPMLSDLRESGAIEQDADIILFVYRDDVYRVREEKEKEMRAKAEGKEYRSNFVEKPEEDAEIIIGKQRNGPTGIVNLIFHKNFTRFVDNTTPVEVVFSNTAAPVPETKIEHVPI